MTTNNNKKLQAQKTRKMIIETATRLFARQGYHKTTINDICQAIGLTSGAVFGHFPSKEALLLEVISWVERGIIYYADYLNQAKAGSLKVIEGLFKIMCDHFNRYPEATFCLASLSAEFAGSNHPVEKRLKEIYERWAKAFSRILKNHPKVKDKRIAALVFIGVAQGIAIQCLLREEDLTADQMTKAFLSMLADW